MTEQSLFAARSSACSKDALFATLALNCLIIEQWAYQVSTFYGYCGPRLLLIHIGDREKNICSRRNDTREGDGGFEYVMKYRAIFCYILDHALSKRSRPETSHFPMFYLFPGNTELLQSAHAHAGAARELHTSPGSQVPQFHTAERTHDFSDSTDRMV